jgi:Carboxypeptidase regulatory-like domain
MQHQIHRSVFLGILIALLGFVPLTSRAQAVYGSLYGTVTDNTGAVVPNANVTVTDEGKGTVVTTQSNGSGDYRVEHMIPDVYDIKVEVSGFETFEAKSIQVLADTSPRVDVKLTPGGASQTVEVSADAIPVLKTDRADVSTTFTAQVVNDLPLNNRNFTSLQLLLPGAQQLGWSHAADENPQGSQQIQIDGQAFGGVAYELDGTDNQDPILGIIVINPPLDAVTEAKIATQNFDAEFGKAVSAVITSQTKSGSNSFHGSAFDYRQSAAQLARDPYSQFAPNAVTGRLIPQALFNQFGGSIGGPFKKDKLFFFGDYQGVRQKVGSSAIMTVPSSHLISTCLGQATSSSGIAGCDFSEYANALSGGNPLIYDPTTGKPFPSQVIPTSRLSTPALNLLKLLQPYAPNKSGSYGLLGPSNYASSGAGLFNNDQWDERVDWQATQRIHGFERFSRFTDTLSGGTLFGPAGGAGFGINGFGGTSTGANDSLASGADIAVNASLLVDFRVGYYRYNIVTSKYDQNVEFANQLGIPNLNLGDRFTSGAPGFNLAEVGSASITNSPSNTQSQGPQYGSGLNITRCNCPTTEKEDQIQGVNNWTKIMGNHSFKFGADFRYARNLRVPSDTDRAGLLSFGIGPTSNGGSGGLGFATFVLGDVTSFGRYIQNYGIPGSLNAKEFQKRLFFYAQDTWRASSKLTVNYGLRWELYFPETVNGVEHGGLMSFNDTGVSPLAATDGFIRVAGVGGIGSNFGWDPAWKALSPRVGIAYQQNPKTVWRAGYGRSFDLGVFGSIFGHTVTQNLPVLANQSVNNNATGATSAAFALAAGPPPNVFPAVPSNGLLPAPQYAVTVGARPNPMRLPTIDAWNLSLQRSINPTLSVTLAYVGNKGTHTLSAGDGNNTNPNEEASILPAQYSITGQPLHYIPASAVLPTAVNGINPDGGTNTSSYLQRYYATSLPACKSAAYTPQPGVPAGACGWSQSIKYLGDDQDTHFNALQVTLAKQFSKGLSFTSNYAWQRAFNWNMNFVTWDRPAVKGRDDSLREQQIVIYGNWLLPVGRNQHFLSNGPGWMNEVVGGWQISPVLNWSSGLPFTLNYSGCGNNLPGDAPCYPNGPARSLPTNLGGFSTATHNRLFFNGFNDLYTNGPQGNFSAPGLDQIGTTGRNTKFGPNFFDTDLAVQKDFPIHESLSGIFRMDAYNVFNHINAGNPNTNASTVNIDQGPQYITSQPPGGRPRQLQLSVRFQF